MTSKGTRTSILNMQKQQQQSPFVQNVFCFYNHWEWCCCGVPWKMPSSVESLQQGTPGEESLPQSQSWREFLDTYSSHLLTTPLEREHSPSRAGHPSNGWLWLFPLAWNTFQLGFESLGSGTTQGRCNFFLTTEASSWMFRVSTVCACLLCSFNRSMSYMIFRL